MPATGKFTPPATDGILRCLLRCQWILELKFFLYHLAQPGRSDSCGSQPSIGSYFLSLPCPCADSQKCYITIKVLKELTNRYYSLEIKKQSTQITLPAVSEGYAPSCWCHSSSEYEIIGKRTLIFCIACFLYLTVIVCRDCLIFNFRGMGQGLWGFCCLVIGWPCLGHEQS